MHSDNEVRSRVVELTKALIRIPSENPPGDQKPIADFIENEIKRIGLQVERYDYEHNKPNVLGRLVGRDKRPILMLNGHVDTVPAGDAKRWSTNPFDPVEKDGRLYGRGASDMKGGIAAMICAAEEIVDAGLDLRGTLLLACVVDEEVTGFGTRDILEKGCMSDFAIVAEPTDLKVQIAHKGALGLEILTKGRPYHASEPRKGMNAVYKMSRVCLALAEYQGELEKITHPLVGAASISVGRIEGGTARNVVPESCRIEAERRILPGEKKENVLSSLESVFRRLEDEDNELELEYHVLLECEPSQTSPDSLIVKKSLEAVSNVIGEPAVPSGTKGTTDMRFLVNQAGIPTVNLGPGNCPHVIDEYVETQQLLDSTKAYCLVAEKLLA